MQVKDAMGPVSLIRSGHYNGEMVKTEKVSSCTLNLCIGLDHKIIATNKSILVIKLKDIQSRVIHQKLNARCKPRKQCDRRIRIHYVSKYMTVYPLQIRYETTFLAARHRSKLGDTVNNSFVVLTWLTDCEIRIVLKLLNNRRCIKQ